MRLFKTIRFNRDLWSIDLWLNIFFIRTRRSLLFGNEVRTFPRAKFSKGLNFYSISFLCAILQYLPFKMELEILPIFNILFKRIFSSDTFKVLESKQYQNNNLVNNLYSKLKFPHFQTASNQGTIPSSKQLLWLFLTIFVPNQAKLPNKIRFELSYFIFKTNLYLSS